jgi:hypothetical protein
MSPKEYKHLLLHEQCIYQRYLAYEMHVKKMTTK